MIIEFTVILVLIYFSLYSIYKATMISKTLNMFTSLYPICLNFLSSVYYIYVFIIYTHYI